jgi:hypothetical protein
MKIISSNSPPLLREEVKKKKKKTFFKCIQKKIQTHLRTNIPKQHPTNNPQKINPYNPLQTPHKRSLKTSTARLNNPQPKQSKPY